MAMGLGDHGVTILNFDGPYLMQPRLSRRADRWVELADIPGTNLLCAEDALAEIRRRLPANRGRGITFIGSGNYHYVTFLLLEKIDRPFTLLLFDHHSDMKGKGGELGLLSCGNWVSQAVERLPRLREVHIVGAVDEGNGGTTPSRGRIRFWPADADPEELAFALGGRDLYISIDKDVLNRESAVTNWDQGEMPLRRLRALLRAVTSRARVIGVDVCGECPRAADIWKLTFAQRQNEKANLAILHALESA